MSKKLFTRLTASAIALTSFAALGTTSASATGVATEFGTTHAKPKFDLNTGLLTSNGSGTTATGYLPTLDTDSVDIHVKGEGVTSGDGDVKLLIENNEPTVYKTGAGASVELPTLDPTVEDVTTKGEGATHTEVEAKSNLDENGIFLSAKGVQSATHELPEAEINGKDGKFYLTDKKTGEVLEFNTEAEAQAKAEEMKAEAEKKAEEQAKSEEMKAEEQAKAEEMKAEEQAKAEEMKAEEKAKAEEMKAEEKAKAEKKEKGLPETGQVNSAIAVAAGLGLLGTAVVIAKRKKQM